MDWLRRLVRPTAAQLAAAMEELSPAARAIAEKELEK